MKLLIIDATPWSATSLKTILETDPQVKESVPAAAGGKLFLFTAVCGPMCC